MIDWIVAFFAQYALEIYAVLFIIAWFALPRSSKERRPSLIVSACAGVLALILNLIHLSHLVSAASLCDIAECNTSDFAYGGRFFP